MSNMAYVNIELPEKLHNDLRHLSIDRKREIRELIVEALSIFLQKEVGKNVQKKKGN